MGLREGSGREREKQQEESKHVGARERGKEELIEGRGGDLLVSLLLFHAVINVLLPLRHKEKAPCLLVVFAGLLVGLDHLVPPVLVSLHIHLSVQTHIPPLQKGLRYRVHRRGANGGLHLAHAVDAETR